MGKSIIPIIILVLALLGSLFFAFNLYNKNQNLSLTVDKLKEEADRLNAEKVQAEKSLFRLRNDKESLSRRLEEIRKDLEEVQAERDKYKKDFDTLKEERDTLVEEIKKLKTQKPAEQVTSQPVSTPLTPLIQAPGETKDAYWQQVLKEKAELQAKLEGINSKIASQKAEINGLKREKQGLERQIEELTASKKEFERQLEFNQRTIEILTKDLVREKEDKRAIVKELERLKKENNSISLELKLANKMRTELEKKLVKNREEKEFLKRKLKDLEAVLKDNALEIDSFQKQLSQTLSSVKHVKSEEAKAVELPPIVVTPEKKPTTPTSVLEGKIIAVNEKERFVIIDLGYSSGIKPGDKFLVVRDGKNIASLEVIETREDIAACDILEVASTQRIKEGDLVKYQ